MLEENPLLLGYEEDEFKVTGTHFVHFFKYMLDNGSIAEMSGTAFKVYFVIKILSDFENGKTTATQDAIAEKAGISKAQVKRAIDELKDLKYLASERHGRKNTYMIIEHFDTAHKSGTPDGIAKVNYRRGHIQKLVKDIRKQFVKTLNGEEIHGIRDVNITINNIENVNINMANNESDLKDVTVDVDVSPVEELNKLPWKNR